MKILFVHDFYRDFGGEDAVALAEKRMLANYGEELVFYDRHNLDIENYSFWQKTTLPAHTIYSWRTKKEVLGITSNFRPDFAYIHNVFPLISPSIYDTLHSERIPSIQVMHDFRFLCPNGWFYTQGQVCERCKHGNYLHAIRYKCFRNSYSLSALYAVAIGSSRLAGLLDKIDGFICLTEFSRQKLREVGIPERKLFVRPNFIDASISAASPGEGQYALYLGRLSAEKGLWTLIRAFEKLKKVELKIAGTGPLEESLGKYLNEKGIKNIQLLGFKEGTEKWRLLNGSLFVIVPSECYETFCMVVLEAYVAGKPVLASNLGGLPYVVEDGKSGILFKCADVDDLADKVNHLVLNPFEVTRMGTRGRELAVSKFSPEQSYNMLIDIVARLT